MAKAGKDSREVVLFRQQFRQLIDWMEDDPAGLKRDAELDESIDELCRLLHWAAYSLEEAQDAHPELFSAPADPKFIAEWRDYEKRWKEAVRDVFWRGLLFDLPETTQDTPALSRARAQWEFADSWAEAEAKALESALEFADDQLSPDRTFVEGYAEEIEDGLGRWRRLKTTLGFDPRGAFRRRRLVPFVLVPRTLSARYGESDKVSLLANLNEAHRAFVFGAPLAALAMMRSILEGVLRDHYLAAGADLNQYINKAERLPSGAPRQALHRLRLRTNAFLHLDPEKAERLPVLGAEELELEIVSLLLVLRALIEAAPESPHTLGRRP